jgi:hypothetical protein
LVGLALPQGIKGGGLKWCLLDAFPHPHGHRLVMGVRVFAVGNDHPHADAAQGRSARSHSPGPVSEQGLISKEFFHEPQCGIVGLPNVGKSTLFNALTKAGIAAENYPFCTIEPNVGVVEVPDPAWTSWPRSST